jgi:hypothetical protein
MRGGCHNPRQQRCCKWTPGYPRGGLGRRYRTRRCQGRIAQRLRSSRAQQRCPTYQVPAGGEGGPLVSQQVYGAKCEWRAVLPAPRCPIPDPVCSLPLTLQTQAAV